MGTCVYTVGHSNHSIAVFLRLLTEHHMTVLVDLRSVPRSHYAPHFDRENLCEELRLAGIAYIYAGDRLGGRPSNPALRDLAGEVSYERVRLWEPYRAGIEDVVRHAPRWSGRTVLMCSEEDPSHCHRRVLVGQDLREGGLEIVHLRGTGRLETEDETRVRLGEDQPNILDMLAESE